MKSAPCNKCGRLTDDHGLCGAPECDDGPQINFRSVVGQVISQETYMRGAKTRVTSTQLSYDMSTVREHTLRQRHFTPLIVTRSDRITGYVTALGASALLSLLAVIFLSRADFSDPGRVYTAAILLVAPIVFFAMKSSIEGETASKAKAPPKLSILMSRKATDDRGSMPDSCFVKVFENEHQWRKFLDDLEREQRTNQILSGPRF